MTAKSAFAIRKEDALSWHDIPRQIAGIAERSGYRTRPNPGWPHQWQIWATEIDLAGLRSQGGNS